MSGLLFCIEDVDRRYLRSILDYTASFLREKSSDIIQLSVIFLLFTCVCLPTGPPIKVARGECMRYNLVQVAGYLNTDEI
jgi:hypothetical protein